MSVVRVLDDAQRFKLDGSDDSLFYSEPRFVHHLDSSFRERLTLLYRERIPPCANVLDLMSSWVWQIKMFLWLLRGRHLLMLKIGLDWEPSNLL